MSGVLVLLVSQNPAFQEHTQALGNAGFVCHVASSAADVTTFVERLRSSADPETELQLVAIVDADLPRETGTQIAKSLRVMPEVPTLTLIAPDEITQLGPQLDSKPTMDEYANKPIGTEELILRVKALGTRAGFAVPSSSPAPLNGRLAGIHHGQVVLVYSPRGGIGKSVVSVNLGIGLTRFFGFKTLVADADLPFGDVGVLLNVGSQRSIADLESQDEVSASNLMQLLAQHASGAHLLLRPPSLTTAERISPERVVELVTSYKALFDYVVVDTQSSLDELNLLLFEAADRILLLTTPEISSLSTVPVDIGALVEGLVGQSLAADRIRVDVPSQCVLVDADPARFAQVLNNVLGNALKYSPPDSIVTARVREIEDSILVEVIDHGVGVDPADIPLLFQKYGRLASARAEGPSGNGLGLYLCRRLVEAHGGSISLLSEGRGHGATVRMRLPLMSTVRGD